MESIDAELNLPSLPLLPHQEFGVRSFPPNINRQQRRASRRIVLYRPTLPYGNTTSDTETRIVVRRRLDVDDMSYEQVLELQERIGNVNTGLSVENITTCLKTRTVNSGDEQIFDETCIVCQEKYKDQDVIGTLKCRHEYHRDCIKEWLLLKNVCPICKRPAQE